jgi:adenylyltransferase/sulfurtransferase
VLGSLQALEALKMLLGLDGLSTSSIRGLPPDEMLIFDLVTLHTQRLRVRRAAGCDAHRRAGQPAPPPAAESLEIEFATLAAAHEQGFTLVDVRDARERDAEPLPLPSLHMPVPRLLTDAPALELGRPYLFICATGKRSSAAADLLRSNGFRHCRSLRGGVKALKVLT